MKSIERRFNNIQGKNAYYSSFTCFHLAVEEQGFSEQMIVRWFNKLVDKEDYSSGEKKAVLDYIYTCSKSPEDNQK